MEINLGASPTLQPLRPGPLTDPQQVAGAEETRATFRTFVGEAFFGQLLKSMRSTQGKPAYFHGGRAEEVFRGQFDQQLAQHMTEASAATIADPMFAQQVPAQAALLQEQDAASRPAPVELLQLRRR